MNPWKKAPVDVIDWTCQQHDNCYGKVQKHPVIKMHDLSGGSLIDVIWGQPIKLIQVVSNSEFHEY